MEEEESEGLKSTVDICVRNPVTHNTWDKGRYTSYEIAVNTTNKSFCLSSSVTRRRFSEFEWLRKILKNHQPLLTPPSLPPKKFFEDRFDPNFIAFRMKGLEDFLNKIMEEKLYLSDTTFHLFLQTNLTIKEIKDYIEGHMTPYSIDSLWKAKGIKENCREFAGLYTEEDSEWSKVHHNETQRSKGNHSDIQRSNHLSVPSLEDDNRDSHNSDISSSFSDSEDGGTEFPSLSLVNKQSSSSPSDQVSDYANLPQADDDTQKCSSQEPVSTVTVNSPQADDSQKSSSQELVSMETMNSHQSSITNDSLGTSQDIQTMELDSVSNFTVSDEFSINKSDDN